MMSVPPSGIYSVDLPYDRSSAQLRAYLRDEHLAGMGWLNLAIRAQSPSLPGRFRRWLAARRSRRESATLRESPEAVPQTVPSSFTADPETCSHPLTEDLGLSGDAGFLRCAVCGDIIVVHGARQWRLRNAADGGSSASGDPLREDSIPAGPAELC